MIFPWPEYHRAYGVRSTPCSNNNNNIVFVLCSLVSMVGYALREKIERKLHYMRTI